MLKSIFRTHALVLSHTTDTTLQSSHEYPTHVVKYTHDSASVLGPQATSIRNTPVGFYQHLEDKHCTFTPLLVFLVCSTSWTVAGSTKPVTLQCGNLGNPAGADLSADANSEGSMTQPAQHEGTPYSPGIHCPALSRWLVSILARALAPHPSLKAHSCLHPNPKQNHSFSLGWSLKKGILLLSESPTQPFMTNLHSLKQGIAGASWRKFHFDLLENVSI